MNREEEMADTPWDTMEELTSPAKMPLPSIFHPPSSSFQFSADRLGSGRAIPGGHALLKRFCHLV